MADQPQNTADMRSGRDASGRFLPGNQITRRGSKNKISRDALTAVQGLSSLAISKLHERIEAGDMAAIKLCLDWTLPRGGRTVETDSTDPMAWGDLLASGDVSPHEAATAAQAMVKLNEAGEIADLAARIAELEALIAEQRRRR